VISCPPSAPARSAQIGLAKSKHHETDVVQDLVVEGTAAVEDVGRFCHHFVHCTQTSAGSIRRGGSYRGKGCADMAQRSFWRIQSACKFTSGHVYAAEAIPIGYDDQTIGSFNCLHHVVADCDLPGEYPSPVVSRQRQ